MKSEIEQKLKTYFEGDLPDFTTQVAKYQAPAPLKAARATDEYPSKGHALDIVLEAIACLCPFIWALAFWVIL